jgi:CRISPR/Cas system-associated exonuclease Cas4 (RecB family)
MAKTKGNQMTVKWSHSALKDYEGCPRRYHEVKVLKQYPFPETEAIRYGKELHSAAEFYIKDDKPLPPQFEFVKDMLDALKAKPGRKLCEHEMGVTADLRPCGFMAEDVWVRGIADLLIIDDDNLTARVVDYKTGNNKYPDREQLRLMALMVFVHFPHIRKVSGGLLFVVKNDLVKASFLRGEAEEYWWDYRTRVARIEKAHESGVWNPKPTPLCGWCVVKTCEYNRKKD